MGEERIPTGFELARENARVMLERTSPSDPTAQAMGSVAENINKMDEATRGLLGKLTKRLEDLANQASASSSEQSKALAGLAQEAAVEFGRVYAASGGVTGEDVEKLSHDLAATMTVEVPAGVEKEAEAVRELTKEFASRIIEAMEGVETATSAVEEVVAKVPPPREAPGPREALAEVSVVARERREGRAAEYERQKKLFVSLEKGVVGGFAKVSGRFLPDILAQIGFLAGGIYAVKDELLMGFQLGWDVLSDTYNETAAWWQDNWKQVPGFFLDLAKDVGAWVGKEIKWLWGQFPVIKRWIIDLFTDPVEAILRLIPGYSRREAEAMKKARVGAVLREEEAIPSGLPRQFYEQAKGLGLDTTTAQFYSRLAERDPEAAGEALSRFASLRHKGLKPGMAHIEAAKASRAQAAQAVEAPVGGITVAAERELQRRTVTTGAESTQGAFEIVRTIARDFQRLLQREGARRGGEQEMPAILDGINTPDDLGQMGVAAGVASGGLQ